MPVRLRNSKNKGKKIKSFAKRKFYYFSKYFQEKFTVIHQFKIRTFAWIHPLLKKVLNTFMVKTMKETLPDVIIAYITYMFLTYQA